MSIQSKFIDKLKDAIRPFGGKLYFVGGVVREELLQLTVKDIDIVVTGIERKTFEKILSGFCVVKLVGKSFGVYKCFKDEYEIDIAFPRKETSTGDGHRDFEMEFGVQISLEEDLYRRDFTINAMAKDIETDEIIDPFGGRRDLLNKILRHLSEISMKEDYLRTLRAIQFVSRLGFDIEEKTLESMKQNNSLIDTISLNRISIELRKFFKGTYIIKAINYLEDIDILKDFYHGISKEQWLKVENFNAQESYDEIIVLAMYLFFINKNKLPKYIKMDKKTENILKSIVDLLNKKIENKVDIKKALNKLDLQNFLRLIDIQQYLDLLSKEDNKKIKDTLNQVFENQEPYMFKHLSVNGKDLIELGLKGKQVGERLNAILDEVIRYPEKNKREYLLSD